MCRKTKTQNVFAYIQNDDNKPRYKMKKLRKTPKTQVNTKTRGSTTTTKTREILKSIKNDKRQLCNTSEQFFLGSHISRKHSI